MIRVNDIQAATKLQKEVNLFVERAMKPGVSSDTLDYFRAQLSGMKVALFYTLGADSESYLVVNVAYNQIKDFEGC